MRNRYGKIIIVLNPDYPYIFSIIIFDYREWNIGINISKVIEEDVYESELLYFNYKSDDDMTTLLQYITDNLPDGGFIYTYMEEEDYTLLVREMNEKGLVEPKYYSTTLLGNLFIEAINDREFFKSTVFIGPYSPFLETKANKDFLLFCKLFGVNIHKFTYREMVNFVNLYELFMVYPEIEYSIVIYNILYICIAPYKNNKRLYFPVFIYTQTFNLPEGNQIVEFNNYLTKTLYLFEYSEESGLFEHILGNERTYVQDGFPFQISFFIYKYYL